MWKNTYIVDIQTLTLDLSVKVQLECKILFGKITYSLDSGIRNMLLRDFLENKNSALDSGPCLAYFCNFYSMQFSLSEIEILWNQEKVYKWMTQNVTIAQTSDTDHPYPLSTRKRVGQSTIMNKVNRTKNTSCFTELSALERTLAIP